VATAQSNAIAGGLFRLFNPIGALARNVAVAGITAAGGAFLVSGFDIHNQAMSETLTATAGTATVYGKKAFKFIASVVPQFTDTATYSIGIGDVIGFPILAPRYEGVDWKWAGLNQTSSTGYLAPDTTSPALATTGDVRGTLQLSNKASSGNGLNSASDGVKRLYITQTLPVWNVVNGTPLNTVPFFGQTQA
jgi:hypothetical protein